MSKTLNFDKFISEKEREKIEVTVFGNVYEVECFVPAIVPVMMARAESSNDPQASVKMVMIAADAMLGRKTVNELCAKGISASDLSELVNRLFKIINGSDGNEDDEYEEVSDDDSRKVNGTANNTKK